MRFHGFFRGLRNVSENLGSFRWSPIGEVSKGFEIVKLVLGGSQERFRVVAEGFHGHSRGSSEHFKEFK